MSQIWIKTIMRGGDKRIGFVLWIAQKLGLEVEYWSGGGA